MPWAQKLMIDFSYLAVFVVSMISTSTIFLPFPLYVIIFFAAGLGMHPFLVGLLAGLGSAVGELSGYFIGLGGRYATERKVEKKIKAQEKKVPKLVKRFEGLFVKYGFWVIILAAALPFPFDFIGILSGASKYNINKFFVATAIGKIIKCLMIAYAGYLAIPYVRLLLVEH